MSDLCRSVQDSLLFYLDGAKSDLPTVAIREHVESCRSCKERLVEIKGLKILLTDLPRRKLPDQAREGISLIPILTRTPRKALPEDFDLDILEIIRKDKGREVSFIQRQSWRWIQTLAAAMIVAMLSMAGYRNFVTLSTYPQRAFIQPPVTDSLYYHTLSPKASGDRTSLDSHINGGSRTIQNRSLETTGFNQRINGQTPDHGSRAK